MRIQNTDKKHAWWWKDPEPDPYLWLTDPDADPGGQKPTDPTDADPDPQQSEKTLWELYGRWCDSRNWERVADPKETAAKRKCGPLSKQYYFLSDENNVQMVLNGIWLPYMQFYFIHKGRSFSSMCLVYVFFPCFVLIRFLKAYSFYQQ